LTLAAVAVAGMLPPAQAGIVIDPKSIGIYNTGVDNSGAKLAFTLADSHYALTSAPSPVPTGSNKASATNTTSPWILDGGSAASRWITPSAYAVTGNTLPLTAPPASGPLATYEYTLSFFLPANYTSLDVVGRWATDNPGQLVVNNVTSGLTGWTTPGWPSSSGSPSPFSVWTSFSIPTSYFTPGTVNTIQFRVNNLPLASGNPTGLRVEFTSAVATIVPEAGTLAMWGLFGALGLALSRRLRPQS
jgi:hypothetical protein